MKFFKRSVILIFIAYFYLSMIAIITLILFINSFNPVKRLRRYITNFLRKTWYHSTMAAAAPLLKGPVWLKYDKRIVDVEKGFAISNHTSDYDWLYMIAIMHHLNKYDELCILMKKSLGDIPGIGYGIRCFSHLLLNRSKERDLELMEQKAKELNSQNKFMMFMYPEGTYPFDDSIKKSNDFAKKENFQISGKTFIPKNVLLPRKTGFDFINTKLEYEKLINMTIILNPYYHIVQNEATHIEIILKEKIKLGQIVILEILENKESRDNFLYNEFSKKDQIVEKYKKFCKNSKKSEIRNIKDFKTLLSKISPVKKNEKIEKICINSKYALILYCIPVGLLLIFVRLIFQFRK